MSDKNYPIYVNGKFVESISQDALVKMSSNLSDMVTRYFVQHPEEYDRYLNSKEHKEFLERRVSS